MPKTPDLTYSYDGIFAVFYAETTAGECAWRTIAGSDDGGAKVLAMHAEAIIDDLRKAGYVVQPAPKVPESDDQLLLELMGA